MKIKTGKIHRDTTSFGNQFWIQITDLPGMDNRDLLDLVDAPVTLIIGDVTAGIDFVVEQNEAAGVNTKDVINEVLGE